MAEIKSAQKCERRKPEDSIGEKFGRLTLQAIIGRDRWNQAIAACLCDCGNSKNSTVGNLRSGGVQSCGCLLLENNANFRHGMTDTPTWKSWKSALDRCYLESHKSYPRYGGRGITICDRWRNSFEAFWSDMGYRPSQQHSIDRIDSNGRYEPGNCRWATSAQQARNRTNNRLNPDLVHKIRKLREEGLGSHRIAKRLGIIESERAIEHVIKGLTWKDCV